MGGGILMKNRNAILYEGIFEFRNAMLPFIVETLKKGYGNGWWKAGVERVLGDQTVTNLQKQFERRYKKSLAAVKRPGQDVEQMLDVGHFLPIISGNWRPHFADVFGDDNRNKVEVWLGEIIEARNAMAHPEDKQLTDEDVWRALDTMERVLQDIDLLCAQRIMLLQGWRTNAVEAGSFDQADPGLQEGPYDYEVGFKKLRSTIIDVEGQGSEQHLKLEAHRSQLVRAFWDKRLHPAGTLGEVETRIERILQELDRLTYQYSQITFREISTNSRGSTKSEDHDEKVEDSFARAAHLRAGIAELEYQLFRLEWKKLAQNQTGEVVGLLERELIELQTRLAEKRDELDHLLATDAPEAYVAVSRAITAYENIRCIEEQPVGVKVTLRNLGRIPVDVHYVECLPSNAKLTAGVLELTAIIHPGAERSLDYQIVPSAAGVFYLSTQTLEYVGQICRWDSIDETVLEVDSGSEPELYVKRFYQLAPGAIRIITLLRNDGDKTAYEVAYAENISVKAQEGPFCVGWQGDIRGHTDVTVEQVVPSTDLDSIMFADAVTIPYRNNMGHETTCALSPGFSRIEYTFPVATDINTIVVGRSAEMDTIRQLVASIVRQPGAGEHHAAKRVLFLCGLEGTGKTRMVHELIAEARKVRCAVFLEDAKSRNPVRQMLRRLLGIVSSAGDDLLLRRLQEALPGQLNNVRREILFDFLSTPMYKDASNEALIRLERQVISTFNILCRNQPTLLIFENAHWTSEGLEDRLFLALLQNVLLNRDAPVLLCVTYRPTQAHGKSYADRAQLPRSHCELIELGNLSPLDVHALVNTIVTFPRFSPQLLNFVSTWSCNPLFVVELLRLLTHADSGYLVRMGGEWYPALGRQLEQVSPRTINDVILERISLELPTINKLAKALSSIGFELPAELVRHFVHTVGDFLGRDYDPNTLAEALEVLVATGILTRWQAGGYQFEHHVKREVLYASITPEQQTYLREQLATILLQYTLFASPQEQTRQLARHIVKASPSFQYAHLAEIHSATHLEVNLRNFGRALELYDAAIALMHSIVANSTPENSSQVVEYVDLLVNRARLHEMRGHLSVANDDLESAQKLVAEESPLYKHDKRAAQGFRTVIHKEKGRLLLRRPNGSLERANDLLNSARVALEGNLHLRRFFPPNDMAFHRNFVEIYLDLAEISLRKRDYKMCEEACMSAERMAKRAGKLWPDEVMLPEVYRKLGNLHAERGTEHVDYERALGWYERALTYAANDAFEQERIWLRIADVHQYLGDISKAKETYQEAIRVQMTLGDDYGLALSYGGIGNLCVEYGEFDEGQGFCEQAFTYQQHVGDVDRFWRTCISLTKIHIAGEGWSRAWKYWLESRPILFEQRRFSQLKTKKQKEIYGIAQNLKVYQRNQKDSASLMICLQDIDFMSPFVRQDRHELEEIQMELGEACMAVRNMQEAAVAFGHVIEHTDALDSKARAFELLGEAHVAGADQINILPPSFSPEAKSQDRAEYCYEQSTKLYLRLSETDGVLRVYEKLINRMITEPEGLLQMPFTFLRLLRVAPTSLLRDRLVTLAVAVLKDNKRYEGAGDIFSYAARESAKIGEKDHALQYLQDAEATYRLGSSDNLLWGTYMVIPTYFRLGCWADVTRCFEQLFDVSVSLQNAKELLEALYGLHELSEYISLDGHLRLTELATEKHRLLNASAQQQLQFALFVAKHYFDIATKTDDNQQKRKYEDFSLEYYQYICDVSPHGTRITSVALNDSALLYNRRGEQTRALELLDECIGINEMLNNHGTGYAAALRNRADLLLKVGKVDEAVQDLESAFQIGNSAIQQWEQRVSQIDESPMSPSEIISMHYDKTTLANICNSYATLLLTTGSNEKAFEFVILGERLRNEIRASQVKTPFIVYARK
jgi:tetratricopeptide (TPR) repeat protein